MLIVAGTVTIDPARKKEAEAAALEIMRETRKEAGNIAYTFSNDLEDPAIVHLHEQWESQAALEAHFETPHMATFQKAMGGLGVKDVSVKKFEISSVGPVR